MLRTIVFLGIAAVAANQLKKSGALDRFQNGFKRRANDLRAHVDAQRAAHREPVNPDSPVGAPQTAGGTAATI